MINLIIILVVVIGLSFSMTKIMNRTVKGKGRYSYSNRVRGIFVGYLAILLFCVVLVSVLPAKGMTDWKVARTGDLIKEGSRLHDAAIKGRIDKVGHKFMVKKWSFAYHDPKLNTSVINNEFLDAQVIIERKDANDDKVEAVYYKGRSSMNNMDITSIYKPIDLKLVGNHLTIIPPQRSKIKFSEFGNVFSVNQFTGEKSFSHSSDFFEGQSILYLRIPKDLQLNDKSKLIFEYVE